MVSSVFARAKKVRDKREFGGGGVKRSWPVRIARHAALWVGCVNIIQIDRAVSSGAHHELVSRQAGRRRSI